MHVKRGGLFLLFGCFAFSSIFAVVLEAGSTSRQDSAWKRYRNEQWGYCVSYPSRWLKGEAFEGSGLYVKTGMTKFSSPIGEMDIEALSNRVEASVEPAVSYGEDVKLHLEGLKKFQHVEQMEQLEQKPMNLFGLTALLSKERYYDPLERSKWVQEVVFAQRADVLYRLELVSRADQITRFEPMFTRMLSTFQADCAGSH